MILEMKNNKIFLTGGTGFLGKEIIKKYGKTDKEVDKLLKNEKN